MTNNEIITQIIIDLEKAKFQATQEVVDNLTCDLRWCLSTLGVDIEKWKKEINTP